MPPVDHVTVSGYLEVYDALNLALPSNRLTNLRAFDDRDRSFTLSNAALGAKAERGPLTAIAILQVGATPASYYAPSDAVFRYVQQATIAYAAPASITVQAGLFPSPIGPEVIPIKDNWNWSRSDLFAALPFYHVGALVSRPLGGGWTATAHVYNGWNDAIDNNGSPSVAASLTYASARVPSAQLMYFGGVERAAGAPEGSPWRHLVDAYAQVVAADGVAIMVHGDGGFERNRFGTSGWLAGAVYGKLELADGLYAAARADLFREWVASDRTGAAAALFWPTPWIGSVTATLALQPIDTFSVRLEVRHDRADTAVFYDRRDSRDTITLGAVAWF